MGMFERANGVGLPESNTVLPLIAREILSLRGHRARHAIQCLLGNSGDLTSSSLIEVWLNDCEKEETKRLLGVG
jgi:hypothetical protein